MSMKTFAQWRADMVGELCRKYDCTRDEALQCLDNWRWYRECIQPAMRAGLRPNEDVAKSLVQHAPYSPGQLEREFLAMHGEDNFWPIGYDYTGAKIQYAW